MKAYNYLKTKKYVKYSQNKTYQKSASDNQCELGVVEPVILTLKGLRWKYFKFEPAWATE